MAGLVRRLARLPLLHFLLLGGLAFALVPEVREPIVIGADEVEALRRTWTAARGRVPTEEEERRMIRDAVDEEVLVREAWAAGLLGEDRVVAHRLAQVGSFVEEAEATVLGDSDDAVARARELGLDRSDPVIRRYLAEMMRLAIGREISRELPSDADLVRHMRTHADRFVVPTEARISHVFASGRRGDDTEARALALLTELTGRGAEAGRRVGDPFPYGRSLFASTDELQRAFGSAFASALETVPPGRWTGPIASAYGAHLVWVHERRGGQLPGLEEVKGQVLHHYLRTRRAELLRASLDELRSRYTIRVELPARAAS